jgi:hypothetical protein
MTINALIGELLDCKENISHVEVEILIRHKNCPATHYHIESVACTNSHVAIVAEDRNG